MTAAGPARDRWPALAMALALALAGGAADAQGLNFGSGQSDQPIEITADNGIEWQQESLVFLARGNAKAVRGEVTVLADELRAYYREQKGGGTDIWRLDAIGNVKIKTAKETAYGKQAIYQVDLGVLVLSGGKVRLVTPTDEITADKQLEYWEKKQMAVARGNAFAVRENKRLKADVLAAYFKPDKAGDSKLYRVDAFDKVTIVTEKDTATSDRGVYNVESGIATLTGSVQLTRGETVLNGCRAVVNLNTGISNLYSCPASGSGPRERARGLLVPNTRKK
ncbi:MAG TPA: LptA/OstA family protein [Rhodospirillales bacterium]|jgi:lipopolysaccharide export system protein LptA